MRHQNAGLKLGRTSSHREAMFRNMVTSLLKHDRIRTTDVKAKELRRWADKIITLAKQGDLNARRQALSIVREKDVVHKLFEEASKRFGSIAGGYTRIVKIGIRPGDAAPISMIELIGSDKSEKKDEKKKKTKIAAKKQKFSGKKPVIDKAKEKAAPVSEQTGEDTI
ncbi:MAG: 50S ribosomal protein L17 [Proteobacteria bacterium]|nr:50S ribosomal protein L17 [Pseudomonadota bacterium]MBU4010468.1 50S ribosomal protein L17 [Pseudomonadota bacterium]MBU4037770.1 50S ribosomal protein L17 [Pseudomonadota bacterium]